MKWKLEKKYLLLGIVAFIVICGSLVFKYRLEHSEEKFELINTFNHTMFPIVWGLVFAYLLNPVLRFFEYYVFSPISMIIWKKDEKEKQRFRFSRGLAILFTQICFFVVVIGGLYLVIPQMYESISKIAKDAPDYYDSITKTLTSLNKNNSEIQQYIMLGVDRVYKQVIEYISNAVLPNMDKIVAGVTSGIVGGVKFLMNLILVVIISIYVMAEKEMLISVVKKCLYGFFSKRNANSVIRGVRYADRAFGGFINGKIIDSFIIGLICYIFMKIAGLEFAVLISIIIGVTNVIPYFGPFIGAIPCALILFLLDPKQGIVFTIFAIVLQQVDGNIIGPIIIGDRLKISSMWILFSILVGGGFFGVLGMILGAPCFACIYAFISYMCDKKLTSKDLPTDASEYLCISFVEEDGNIIYSAPEKAYHRREKERKEKQEEQDSIADSDQKK